MPQFYPDHSSLGTLLCASKPEFSLAVFISAWKYTTVSVWTMAAWSTFGGFNAFCDLPSPLIALLLLSITKVPFALCLFWLLLIHQSQAASVCPCCLPRTLCSWERYSRCYKRHQDSLNPSLGNLTGELGGYKNPLHHHLPSLGFNKLHLWFWPFFMLFYPLFQQYTLSVSEQAFFSPARYSWTCFNVNFPVIWVIPLYVMPTNL